MDTLSFPDDDPRNSQRWMHDLRNAANSTQLAVDVAYRMMAAGDLLGAETNLRRAVEACGILTDLLNPNAAST